MKYSQALDNIAKARDQAELIKKELDTALMPSTGIDDWHIFIDQSILKAHEASKRIEGLLGGVVAADNLKPEDDIVKVK